MVLTMNCVRIIMHSKSDTKPTECDEVQTIPAFSSHFTRCNLMLSVDTYITFAVIFK